MRYFIFLATVFSSLILFGQTDEQNTYYIFSNSAENMPLEEPKVYFGDLRDSIITREYLLSNPGLIVSYDPAQEIPFSYVSSCELAIIKEKGDQDDMTIYGNAFSDKQLRKLNRLKAGNILLFKSASISCPSCDNNLVDINLKLVLAD